MATFGLFGLAVVADLVLGTLGTAVEAVIVAGAVINASKVIVETLKEITTVFDTLIENNIAGIDA